MLKKRLIFFLIMFFSTLIDQLSKYIINFQVDEKIIIIPKILSFEKVFNTGAAFSILQNNTFLLILITLIVLGFIFYYILKKELKTFEVIALALISGGATGNLIDRLINGFVIDFIQTDFINFPIFNFADVFINIGVIILIVSILCLKHDE